jgi:hypothetical protein
MAEHKQGRLQLLSRRLALCRVHRRFRVHNLGFRAQSFEFRV